MKITVLWELWRALVDLLFPRSCAVCGEELLLHEKHICTACMAEMPLTYFWTFKENPAFKTFYGRVNVESVYSLFYYTESYRRAVHSFKYNSNVKLGLWLGELLGGKITEPIDYIIPVPLHYRKELKRGFNQSHIIAKGIARGMQTQYGEEVLKNSLSGCRILKNLLRRQVFTKTQTHKERLDRWHNVERVFSLNNRVAKKHNLNGKHILLVDDVLTTGATLDACCQILLQRYNCRISIATLAYVE